MAESLEVKERESVVVRFSGDSGDGMQLAGNIFSTVSATVGNSISTFPDYPADIRAPQGSLTGVSGFQVHIGAGDAGEVALGLLGSHVQRFRQTCLLFCQSNLLSQSRNIKTITMFSPAEEKFLFLYIHRTIERPSNQARESSISFEYFRQNSTKLEKWSKFQTII